MRIDSALSSDPQQSHTDPAVSLCRRSSRRAPPRSGHRLSLAGFAVQLSLAAVLLHVSCNVIFSDHRNFSSARPTTSRRLSPRMHSQFNFHFSPLTLRKGPNHHPQRSLPRIIPRCRSSLLIPPGRRSSIPIPRFRRAIPIRPLGWRRPRCIPNSRARVNPRRHRRNRIHPGHATCHRPTRQPARCRRRWRRRGILPCMSSGHAFCTKGEGAGWRGWVCSPCRCRHVISSGSLRPSCAGSGAGCVRGVRGKGWGQRRFGGVGAPGEVGWFGGCGGGDCVGSDPICCSRGCCCGNSVFVGPGRGGDFEPFCFSDCCFFFFLVLCGGGGGGGGC